MKTNWRFKFIGMGILALALSLGVVRFSAFADDDDDNTFKAKLNGFKVVPPVLTNGTGTFTATLDTTGTMLSFTETFSGLTGTATSSHIHFAQPGVTGGILVTLCGTPAPSAGGACPAATSGTVSGTITGASLQAIPTQGVVLTTTAANFAALLRILKSGDAYVDVHTTSFTGGEIRGQVKVDD